jgi:mxaA protein
MKKPILRITAPKYWLLSLLSACLVMNASTALANDAATNIAVEPKVLSVTNPGSTYGVHIGDKLSRKVVLEVPSPYQIASSAFPKKGTKHNGVELVDVHVETEQKKTGVLYTVNLSYQTFTDTATPKVMHLPAVKFAASGASSAGDKPKAIEVPAWGFWFSPLVTGSIDTAQKNMQPEIMPPLVDIKTHQTRFAVFLSALAISLMTLLYMNADGQWLPFMGGAFARAHRQLKRLAKSSAAKTSADEKQALVYVHQAFNQHYGANIFARDIERFVTMRPSFRKMQAEIEQFFNHSNQSLYATDARNSKQVISDLVQLSKQLRDCERGV